MKSKNNHPSLFTGLLKIFIVFSVFLLLFTTAEKKKVVQKWTFAKNYYEKPKVINIKADVETVSPKVIDKPFNWTVEKVDDHITKIALPPDDRMSTSDELFLAMNTYRSANALPTIQKSDKLCEIAKNRADEQVSNGGLDNHVGFDKFAQNQDEFSRMGEVLFGGSQPQLGVHIVELGWDRSLTGHREAIRNPSWQYGCGGVAGYYAVFIFGTH